MRADIGPDAVRAAAIVAQPDAAAGRHHAAPGFAAVGRRIACPRIGEQRAGDGAPRGGERHAKLFNVGFPADAADPVGDLEAERRGAEVRRPDIVAPADAQRGAFVALAGVAAAAA